MAQKLTLIVTLLLAVGLLGAPAVNAQVTALNSNVPPGFAQTGYIQAATCDAPCGPASGGTLTMDGIKMIVPANSVVQFPANTQPWSALFDPTVSAPVNDLAPVIPTGKTGLALMDNPSQAPGISPYLPFNAIVQGNIDVKGTTFNNVTGGFNPPGTYIVGLIVPINQDIGNGGQGFVTFIDYVKGRFEVGGILNQKGTGVVIEINDPTGRYGKAHSPDPRWSVDNENPTIATGNGYPMCIPRVAPPAIDSDCPTYNRPLNPPVGAPGHDNLFQPGAPLQAFIMPPSTAPASTRPDPWAKVPLMIGDYLTYFGVLYKNVPNAPLNPGVPINQQTYISANTVGVDKLAAYTAAGTADKVGPAYIQLARMVIGTGGNINGVNVLQNANLGIVGGNIILPEPRNNIVIVGFTTDSSQLVDLIAVDIDPISGNETCRILGTALPEPGVFQGVIAKGNKGRFRFEVGKGNFQPVTRVYAAYSHHGQTLLPDQTNGGTLPQPPATPTPASTPQLCTDTSVPLSPDLSKGGSLKNGLYVGQYHAPMFTFQFPDAPPGFPNIPNNFGDLPFLTQGEGATNPNPSAGPLIPQPPICPNVTTNGVTTPTCQP